MARFNRKVQLLFLFFAVLTLVQPKRIFRLLPVELGDEFVSNFDQINQKAFQRGGDDDDDEFNDSSWKPKAKAAPKQARRAFGGQNVDFDEILPDKKDTAFAKSDGVVYFVSEDGNTNGQVSGGSYNYEESSESDIDLGADNLLNRRKAYHKAKRPDYFKGGSDFGSSDGFPRFNPPKEHVKYVNDIPIKKTFRYADEAPEFFQF
uniref:Uncharacterized protein n=1 Tax=Panagrellus redivivus TaxID=6233 RepID=A0A7E4V3M9_PANRE